MACHVSRLATSQQARSGLATRIEEGTVVCQPTPVSCVVAMEPVRRLRAIRTRSIEFSLSAVDSIVVSSRLPPEGSAGADRLLSRSRETSRQCVFVQRRDTLEALPPSLIDSELRGRGDMNHPRCLRSCGSCTHPEVEPFILRSPRGQPRTVCQARRRSSTGARRVMIASKKEKKARPPSSLDLRRGRTLERWRETETARTATRRRVTVQNQSNDAWEHA